MDIESKIDIIQKDVTELKIGYGEIRTSIKFIGEKLDTRNCSDHESRIRSVESHKSKLSGVWILLAVALPLLISIIALIKK